MNMNVLTPEAGRTVRIGLAIYEKVFSIISEVNYLCGPVNGNGLTVADAFNALVLNFLGGLSGVDEIHIRLQMKEHANPDAFQMSVELDAETSRALDEIAASVNHVLKFTPTISCDVILELLVRRCSRDLRQYLFSKYRQSDFRPIKP